MSFEGWFKVSRDEGLKVRFSIAWEKNGPVLPGLSDSSKSLNFSALGTEWHFSMFGHPMTNVYVVFLDRADKKPVTKPFRVTTFIETEANPGLPLLPYVATVGPPDYIIWSHRGEKILECLPQFHSGCPFKIVCMFHADLPSDMQNVNETVNVPPMITFDSPSCSGHIVSNLPNRTMSADKSVQACLELSSDLESLSLDFSNLPDVKLRCGNHTFPAHRAVLAARSDVFAAMFQNQMVESESGIVDINDLDAPTLELFLKYLYSGKVPSLSDDIVLKLYAAADKYALLALKKACSERMVGSPTEENCLDFLVLADTYSDKELKDAVVNFILANTSMLKSQAWSNFREKYPKLAFSVYDVIVTQKCFSV